MTRKMHMCLNIEGAIRNAKDLKGCITTDDGVYLWERTARATSMWKNKFCKKYPSVHPSTHVIL